MNGPAGSGPEAAGAEPDRRTPADLAQQLRDAADRLVAGWAGATAHPPAGLPVPPATLSARQLQAVLDDVAARRAQVQALQAQLGAFDEQLGTLEASLAPLLEWTRTWAGVESAVTDLWRAPRSR